MARQLNISAILSLKKTLLDSDVLIIIGDFNIPNIRWGEHDAGVDFIPIISSNNIDGDGKRISAPREIAIETTSTLTDNEFHQMCSFVNNWGNVLDLVYTNMPELLLVSSPDFMLLSKDKSDPAHRPIMCTVEVSPEIHHYDQNNSQIYCFRKADYDRIRDRLMRMDFQRAFSDCDNDVNRMMEVFYQIINDTFKNFVPRSKRRISNKPEWHDQKLSQLKNRRNKEYKKLCDQRLTIDTCDEETFLRARNEYECYRHQLHNDFIRQKADNAKYNPKSFWKHINGKRKTNSLPKKMNYGNEMATNDREKAELFAKFFSSVYMKHQPGDTGDMETFLDHRRDKNYFNILLTPESIHAVLCSMDLNKGSGFDGVSSFFLRECAEVLSHPLSLIFTQSMETHIYPESLKVGQVTPIFKAGAINNYRGVNVLPNIAKVFERVIYNQLKLCIIPRISETQHGFVSNRNIETNLMEFTIRTHHAFEQKAQFDVFYADISKAFDSVNTSMLIRKMATFPISNNILKWFISYLQNRRQYVRLGGGESD